MKKQQKRQQISNKKQAKIISTRSVIVLLVIITLIIVITGALIPKKTSINKEKSTVVLERKLSISSDNASNPYSDSSYYFVLGKNSIKDVKIVGVFHKTTLQVEGEISVKDCDRIRYDRFWKEYMQQSGKMPGSIVIANEGLQTDQGGGGVGNAYQIFKPGGFITPYMFNMGINKIAICETRPSGMLDDSKERNSLHFFSKKNVEINVGGKYDPLGIPVVSIKGEIKFSPEQVDSVKNIWYPKYHLEDKKFEEMVNRFVHRTPVIPVVGAHHAINLYREGKVDCIALTISQEEFFRLLGMTKEEDYFLQMIGK